MSKGTNTIPFHGIVTIGNTKADAVANYKKAILGTGVQAFTDGDKSFSFVTNAHSLLSEMFNPLTGDLDLVKSPAILRSFSFGESQENTAEVEHVVCKNGCGSHIISESAELLHFCPVCTTSLSGEEEDESEETEEESDGLDLDDSDESEEESVEEETSESGDDEESEEDDLSDDDLEGETSEDDESEEEDSTSESGDDCEEDEEEEATEETSDDENVVVAADSLSEAVKIYTREKRKMGVVTASGNDEIAAHYLVCSSDTCGAHIVADVNLEECPACSSHLIEPVSLSEDDEEDNDLQIIDSDEDESVEDDDSEGEEESTEEGEEEASEDDDSEGEEESTEEEEATEETSESSDETVVEDEPVTDPETEEYSEDALEGIEDTSESSQHLDVSYSASVRGKPMWTAYIKGVPVATAVATDAGKNADIFDMPHFGEAVLAGAKHAGPVSMLKEMGFKPLKHTVKASSIIKKKVEASVNEFKTSISTEQKEYKERFMAALATAAIGVNRGFFPGLQNPVKAALWDSMSTAGIKNPEVLINNAFKSHSDDYHKIILAKATEILGKPDEVQESLAKAVLDVNYQSVSSSNPTEERLANVGQTIPTSVSSGTNVISVTQDQMISKVVSGLGRR